MVKTASSQFSTKDGFAAKHEGFSQGAPMVSTLLLPLFMPSFANLSQFLISGMRGAFIITDIVGIALRRCVTKLELEREWGLRPQPGISTPAPRPNHNDYRYTYQSTDHLSCCLIDPYRQFAPSAAFAHSVLSGFPLSFPLDLDSGRIHHDVDSF